MRNLGSINESEDIVTKDYADQKLPGRPITKYDYDHLSPAEKDADIVYFIIDDDQDTLEFDEVPTAGSDNPVKSKGIKSALDAKQNTLTFDQTPTAGSQNPVTSDGVKSAISTIDSHLSDVYDTSGVGSLTGLKNGLNPIFVAANTEIGSVTMPNNMRGVACKNGAVVVGFIASYDGSARYIIGNNNSNTWVLCSPF